MPLDATGYQYQDLRNFTDIVQISQLELMPQDRVGNVGHLLSLCEVD
jgi:hypothetical protein